jgi:hypothetical protein
MFTIVVGQGTWQSGVANLSLIDWTLPELYIRTKINDVALVPVSRLWSVPYTMVAEDLGGPVDKLQVVGAASSTSEDALFEVKNKSNQTVFAVYNGGVRVHVDNLSKDPKGGFSVGGFDAKVDPVDYLTVTRDFTEVNVNRLAGKEVKGGFSVGGFDATGKTDPSNFMILTPENYFIGEGSGMKITDGMYNSTLGYNAGRDLTTAWNNVLIGFSSGLKTTEGSNNLFIGNNSGSANINGQNNIFLGVSSGLSNTGGIQSWMGSNNIFIGLSSGLYNTLGGSNIFIGNDAGQSNTEGNLNIYIGDKSGFSSTGVRNTFIGAYTGQGNNTGNDNIYIGNQTGQNSSGSENTFLGSAAGWQNGSGSSNTYIGYASGTQIVGGIQNTFLGTNTGGYSTAGNRNTYIGYQAGSNNDSDGNVFIGNEAGTSEENGNRLYIHNSSSGPDYALIYGEFDNEILKLNATVTIRDLLKIKPGTAPASPEEGDIYYDATNHMLRVYDGYDWQDCWVAK